MSNDVKLKQAVLDELKWEPSINEAHIGVTAKDGVITLMGHVLSYCEKSAAEKAVRRVKDVRGIAEELEVILPLSLKQGDEEIAAAAVARMKWDSAIRGDTIRVKVEKGLLTLSGEVAWNYQKDIAANHVRGLWGVIGVSNNITITPRLDTSKVKSDIVAALERSRLSPKKINVIAKGGNVKLTGKVDTWFERDEAGVHAWSAPGTISVENDITVS